MSAMASQITSSSIVYSTVSSGADQRKHQSPAPLAFVSGIHRWPVNSPHKEPVTRNIFHLITSSWLLPSLQFIHPLSPTLTHPHAHSPVHYFSPIHSTNRSLSLTHSFTHPVTHSFTPGLLTHSLTHSLSIGVCEAQLEVAGRLCSHFSMITSWNGSIFRVTGPLCREFTGHRWISLTKVSNAEIWYFLWSAPEQTVEQTIETPVIWDVIVPIMTSL